MSEKPYRYTIREISRMTPKDICYLLNCKNRIIKQQEDKLWEIRLITESKLIGCDDDE